jgi:hypothetical protein
VHTVENLGVVLIFAKSVWGFMLFGLNPQAGIFIYYYLGEICFGGPISYPFHPTHHLYAFKFFFNFHYFYQSFLSLELFGRPHHDLEILHAVQASLKGLPKKIELLIRN